jgi:hypothetical protein
MRNQLTRGLARRVMYIENKSGPIGGVNGRIGWVSFSRSGRSVYYRDLVLTRLRGGGISGNYFDQATSEEYWVSGIKQRGTNAHWAEAIKVEVDPDAEDEYRRLRQR